MRGAPPFNLRLRRSACRALALPLALSLWLVAPEDSRAASPWRIVILTGADPTQPAAVLQDRAFRRALEAANMDAADIDLIIVATATPDQTFPASATLVQSFRRTRREALCGAAGRTRRCRLISRPRSVRSGKR